MPTNYPTSLDNFTNPTANDSLNLPSHSTQHANANDAIEAIEAKLGVGNADKVGMYSVVTTDVSGASTLTFDNVFTSAYKNYRVVLALTGTTTTGSVSMQLRAGGVTNSANYSHASVGYISNNSGTNGYSNGIASSWQLGYAVNSLGGLFSGDFVIYNPQVATYSTLTGTNVSTISTTNNYTFVTGGMMNVTTQFDGFIITTAGNMTGQVSVYGMRNT